jgi:dihydrofolate reductase
MAKLIYSAITSLDGFVADADGNFDWAVPDDEVHAFVNDLERPIGTYLYGRRMYDLFITPVMVGRGKPALPGDGRLNCELLDERRFGSGVVHLHYRIVYAQ